MGLHTGTPTSTDEGYVCEDVHLVARIAAAALTLIKIGNTFSASGVFLFRSKFHIFERFTVTGGVTRVEFERDHLHIFGDC
jgi:hypothetical protein